MMKKILLLQCVFVALLFLKVKANDSCTIFLNKKTIFKGAVDQENAVGYLNLKHVRYKKCDCITIKFKSDNENKGWYRTFFINTENDQQIKKIEMPKQSGAVTVSATVLNKQQEKRQPFFIYTTSLPADKKMAASIRVRRVLICKIEWN